VEWALQYADDFKPRWNRFQKKHRSEAEAMAKNLDKYFKALSAGVHPMQIGGGFIHAEPKGIKALDQKGSATPKPTQTRLYIYPEIERGLLHIVTVGTKSDQRGDIKTVEAYVERLRQT
jgi:hypothetical protein